MKKIVFGIAVDDSENSIIADDGSITILQTNAEKQSFSFYETQLEKFAAFFKKYNCVAIGFSTSTKPGFFNIDAIPSPEKITKLSFSLNTATQVIYTGIGAPFKNLKSINVHNLYPENFPSLHNIPTLKVLFIRYRKETISHWITVKNIEDLHINNYDGTDLTSLAGMTGLRRLVLGDGKMQSLDGIERLPNLETLHICKASKLVDLTAILKSKTLKNVMFEMYKKTIDWDFLKKKKDLAAISVDTAKSVEFAQALPNLEFFFCKKAEDKNNKSFLYSKTHFQDQMTRAGMQVSYIVTADRFYQPLVELKV